MNCSAQKMFFAKILNFSAMLKIFLENIQEDAFLRNFVEIAEWKMIFSF
jgi:hypothetical protein